MLVAVLMAVTSTAHAQSRSFTFRSGGLPDRALDVVRVTVHNRAAAVVTRIQFVNAVPGNVVLLLRPRNSRAVRIINLHRRRSDRTFVWAGGFESGRDPVACPGVRASWSARADAVSLRLPARCLNAGSYGAIRFGLLTELPSGGDADAAGSRLFIRRG
jgi:hypothetical protein